MERGFREVVKPIQHRLRDPKALGSNPAVSQDYFTQFKNCFKFGIDRKLIEIHDASVLYRAMLPTQQC